MSRKAYSAYKPSGVEWLGEIPVDLKKIEKEISDMLEGVTG